jgi:hypothetical protein
MSVKVDKRVKLRLEKEAERRGVTVSAIVEGILTTLMRDGVGSECPTCAASLRDGVKVVCRKAECPVFNKGGA